MLLASFSVCTCQLGVRTPCRQRAGKLIIARASAWRLGLPAATDFLLAPWPLLAPVDGV